MDLEITDYRHKDHLRTGDRVVKKVLAQQVECVYPAAVGTSTGVVPDIYKLAPVTDGWIELETDLAQGDRVRLIAGEEDAVHEVLEVEDGRFRTSFAPAEEELFVFGREVDDFRTVDYDAISMLNVSATRELHRRLQTQE